MPFRFYLLVSGVYPDGRFVLGRKTNRFISVGRCTYELNPRIMISEKLKKFRFKACF